MAYTVPVFNVPVDVWDAGHVPDDDAPDFEGVTCQFYIYSRGSFDVQPCELELYTPPLQIRMPASTSAIWISGQVFEVPAESGRYYRARFKDRLHLGFPNEYLVVWVVQCNGAGVPLIRDIENAEPCGVSPPPEGEGEMSLSLTLSLDGAGTVTSGDAVGEGDVFMFFTLFPDGEGTVS